MESRSVRGADSESKEEAVYPLNLIHQRLRWAVHPVARDPFHSTSGSRVTDRVSSMNHL